MSKEFKEKKVDETTVNEITDVDVDAVSGGLENTIAPEIRLSSSKKNNWEKFGERMEREWNNGEKW